MYAIIARLKSFPRWIAYKLGAEFVAYSDAARETSGYNGWYEWRDRVVAFQRDDHSVQFCW